MKKSKRSRWEEEWLSRIQAQQEVGGEDAHYYPEETEFSPKSRDPDTTSRRKIDIARLQEDLQGHLIIPYYHLPPYRARFVDGVDRRVLNAGATENILTATIPFSNAVLRWFGNDIEETAGWGNVTWQIQINGVPWDPWSSITRQLGTISLPTPIFINLVERDVLRVNINNSGGANYTVLTRLKGWYW